MELSSPLGITRCVPREKFPQKPNNKSFINEAIPAYKMYSYKKNLFTFNIMLNLSSQPANTGTSLSYTEAFRVFAKNKHYLPNGSSLRKNQRLR